MSQKLKGFRKKKEFPNIEQWCHYLESELFRTLERLNQVRIDLRNAQQANTERKHETNVNHELDEVDSKRVMRIHEMRGDVYARVHTYQDKLTEIKKAMSKARGINQRKALEAERRHYAELLRHEQATCSKLKVKIKKANKPTTQYFLDLLKSEEVLGEDYYNKLWTEALSIREQAIREDS